MKAYYCNKKCEIIKDLGDVKLIKIIEDFHEGEVEMPLLVDSKYISKEKRNLEKELDAHNQEIKQLSINAQVEKQELEKEKEEIADKIQELNNKHKEMREKYKQVDVMINIFEGVYKYVIYDNKIEKLDETFDDLGNHRKELRALVIRCDRKAHKQGYKVYINHYMDASGKNHDANFFETIESAVKHYESMVIEYIDNDGLNSYYLKTFLENLEKYKKYSNKDLIRDLKRKIYNSEIKTLKETASRYSEDLAKTQEKIKKLRENLKS